MSVKKSSLDWQIFSGLKGLIYMYIANHKKIIEYDTAIDFTVSLCTWVLYTIEQKM